MPTYHPGQIGRIQALEQRFKKYGLTVAEYGRMRDRQHNACAICKHPASHGYELVVDHDHATHAVRGLLCSPCNKAIGMMRDNAVRLRAAAAYLERAGSAAKDADGLPVATRDEVLGRPKCYRCGYSKRPERVRAGLCGKCRSKIKRQYRATAEHIDAETLEREAGNYWYTDEAGELRNYADDIEYHDERVRFEDIDAYGNDRYTRMAYRLESELRAKQFNGGRS